MSMNIPTLTKQQNYLLFTMIGHQQQWLTSHTVNWCETWVQGAFSSIYYDNRRYCLKPKFTTISQDLSFLYNYFEASLAIVLHYPPVRMMMNRCWQPIISHCKRYHVATLWMIWTRCPMWPMVMGWTFFLGDGGWVAPWDCQLEKLPDLISHGWRRSWMVNCAKALAWYLKQGPVWRVPGMVDTTI